MTIVLPDLPTEIIGDDDDDADDWDDRFDVVPDDYVS